MIVVVLAFVGVLGLVLGAYFLFIVKPEQQSAETLKKRLKGTPTGTAKHKSSKILRREDNSGSLGSLDQLFSGLRGGRKLNELIEQSGVKMTVGSFFVASALFGLIAFVIGFVAFRMVVVGLILAPVAAFGPLVFLRWKRDRRITAFEEQFPEALDLLARSLRAGHALTTGIALVAEEMPAPVGPEFRLLYDRQNFGMPFPDALRDFGERIPVLDAKFFTTAVLIQRESGGNLSEVLGNLSSVIRERFRVKRQVRVLSAHGRITGWVLSGLPPALAAAFMVTSPNHMQTLTTQRLGQEMIIGAICLQLLGTLIIRKLVNIEY
jgi:tight adherence protein B